MAKLVRAGEWNVGEEFAARALAAALPETWVIVANVQVVQGSGTRELDLIVIGMHQVFVCECKFWSGRVRVKKNDWKVNGGYRSSPNNQVQSAVKVLTEHLDKRLPGWGDARVQAPGRRLARGHVILTHPDVDLRDDELPGRPPLGIDVVLMLADAPARLRVLDAAGVPIPKDLRRTLIDYIAELPPSLADELPDEIYGFLVTDSAEEFDGVLRIPAINAAGYPFELEAVPVDDQPEPALAHRRAVREYEAIESLGRSGRTRIVESWFKWDVYIVTPVRVDDDAESLHDFILKADAYTSVQAARIAADAFAALAEVHAAGVVHRALRPKTIEVAASGRVRFAAFSRARLAGRATVSLAGAMHVSDAFAPPGTTLALRTEIDDVYSLALSLVLWLSSDATSTPDHEHCRELALERGDELGGHLATCLDRNSQRRQPAAEVARALLAPSAETESDRYQYRSRIGRGAMGEIWSAFDQRLNREVAIKRLPDGAKDAEGTDRFRREMRLLASLDHHPHIVSVLDHGIQDDDLYLVMPRLDARPLMKEVEAKGALGLVRTVRLVEQIARALDAAHRSGLVHRDVTPSNVLLDNGYGDDFAYLIDFGIASAGTSTTTGRQSVHGTSRYMAPERFSGGGSAAARAPAVDIYALGCLTHLMLTGSPPYESDDVGALAYMHISQPPPYLEGFSDAINHVVARALAKEPERRQGTAGRLARELQEAASMVSDGGTPSQEHRGQLHADARGVTSSRVAPPHSERRTGSRPSPTPESAETQLPSHAIPSNSLAVTGRRQTAKYPDRNQGISRENTFRDETVEAPETRAGDGTATRGLNEAEHTRPDDTGKPPTANDELLSEDDEVWPELILLREKYGVGEPEIFPRQPVSGATTAQEARQPAPDTAMLRLLDWADRQLSRANMMWQREGKREEAIVRYRIILDKIERIEEDRFQLVIARAMTGLAGQLAAATNIASAIDVNNALLRRFEHSSDREVQNRVVGARVALEHLARRRL